MLCNSCMTSIASSDLVRCEQCGVPLHQGCSNRCLSCGMVLCDVCYTAGAFHCENCALELDKGNPFSVIRRSHLEQYAGCPYSFYLQVVKGIEPPMSNYAQLGILVHDLVDRNENYGLTIDECYHELSEEVRKWNEENQDEYSLISEELYQVGKLCLTNYFELRPYLDFGDDASQSEENIIFEMDGTEVKVSCTLDRLVRRNGEYHILDWKTGRPMAGKKLVTDLQPPLYLYGVKQKYGKLPKTFTLFYLQHNKHIQYQLVDEEAMVYEVKTTRNTYRLDLNEALERTKEVIRNIAGKQFQMQTDGGSWRCKNMCWFGSAKKCDGVDAGKWAITNRRRKSEEEGDGE